MLIQNIVGKMFINYAKFTIMDQVLWLLCSVKIIIIIIITIIIFLCL